MPLIGSTQETNPNTTSSDRPKALLDEQNRQLVERVQLIQSKLDWLKAKLELKKASFTTQQAIENNGLFSPTDKESQLDEILGQTQNLKKASSYIDYVNDCFNYYDNDGEYKRKPNSEDESVPSIELISTLIQGDGSLMVKGRVNNAPDNFDYQSLRVDFFGDAIALSQSRIMVAPDGNGNFTIFIDDATITSQYEAKTQNEGGPDLEIRITNFEPFHTTNQSFQLASAKKAPSASFPPRRGIDVAAKLHIEELRKRFGVSSGQAAVNQAITYILGKKPFQGYSENFYKKDVEYFKALNSAGWTLHQTKQWPRLGYDFLGNPIAGYRVGGTILLRNFNFKSKLWLRQTLIHEYTHRIQFIDGSMFKQSVEQSEIEAFRQTSSDPKKQDLIKAFDFGSDITKYSDSRMDKFRQTMLVKPTSPEPPSADYNSSKKRFN